MAGYKDLKLPVPPGFNHYEVCTYYYENKYPQELEKQVIAAMKNIEKLWAKSLR